MADLDSDDALRDELAPGPASASVLLLVVRRMRAPLVTIILVYAVSVLGLAMIPGVDADGRPAAPMSIFHALYFVSYTATTIGFGEVPDAFSNAQRMWTIGVIHMTVIGWTWAVLTLIALFNDAAFQRAVGAIRFGRRVRRVSEPFFLILGCGDTGQRLIRNLDRRDLRFVVVERRPERIAELELDDFRTDAPAIAADARSPEVLTHAGITHPMCAAVLALTNDDHANLAVAASARLLNPRLQVLARAHTPKAVENLRSFGTQHVIDPFETFAGHLVLAMRAPGAYRLLVWLTAAPDVQLGREHEPPRGDWVICGYGRFGRAVRDALAAQGTAVRIVDPAVFDALPRQGAGADACGMAPQSQPGGPAILDAAGQALGEIPADAPVVVSGVGTEREVLERAGVCSAEGLVAGTDDDIANLAIIAMARSLNPKLFVVARQNEAVNQALFERIRADLVMRPSEIIAEEALARLTTPLLDRFLDEVRGQTDAWADEAIFQLRKLVGTRAPRTWTITLDAQQAPAVLASLRADARPLLLGELLRDPRDRDQRLALRALMVLRAGRQTTLPNSDFALAEGDRILFAGRSEARRHLELGLANGKVLGYLRTGKSSSDSLVWRLFERK